MKGPLEGIRVVDFSKFLPGPYCTWLLADLGAEVIRIEHPRELAKQAQVFGWDKLPEAERARIRAQDVFARGKRSLLIDPGADASRPVLEELVRRADVLVEDYRPGVLASMGYGYEPMAALNPRLVYASVTLCGQTGPYRDKPGHDPVALAVAGALSRIGEDPDAPGFAGVPAADLLTGSNAVIGILAALIARATTGRGQAVDIAMSDSAMALIGNVISRNPDLSKAPPRGRHRADIGIYRTADDRFLVTTDMEPRYWQRFCEAMGRPDYAPLQNDKAARPGIRAFLEAAFAEKPLAHWLALLAAADTQFAPVSSIEEALADPHNIARGMAITVESEGGPVRQIGSPIHLSDTPPVPPRAARIAGADNDAILKELGLQ
ncbi:CaiB/BaiF CoA-transferase family protein [Sphingomonas sp. AOB5]|uniref:CaiB/BaiF CoA transferase family protein n=1 Tax=Sphingomonas sp. AOB5 TaxID=3034017 RepID=UPI0023F6BB18|nr:CaiB/BaiF CoA-transferase family protein [Sphingomonas sp. AOB5]MDF7776357.1 CaiB/BaiF CoA-transferase family protein [Sphingomonas sp. AOB5]